jgi:hypothetical protein
MHIWLSGKKIWVARIYVPRSTVKVGFWSLLAILPLKRGGGGLELDAHLSTTYIGVPRSTARVPFRTPFIILPLTRRGGGSEIERASLNDLDLGARIYGQGWIPDPLCLSTFNKGGGGSRIGGLKCPPPLSRL